MRRSDWTSTQAAGRRLIVSDVRPEGGLGVTQIAIHGEGLWRQGVGRANSSLDQQSSKAVDQDIETWRWTSFFVVADLPPAIGHLHPERDLAQLFYTSDDRRTVSTIYLSPSAPS